MEIAFWVSVATIVGVLGLWVWWARHPSTYFDRRQPVTKITDSRGNAPVDLVADDRKRAFVREVHREEFAGEMQRGEHDYDHDYWTSDD